MTDTTAAEQSVVGAMLMDDGVIDDVMDIIRPGDFQDHRHSLIATACVQLFRSGTPVDVVSVGAALGGDLTKAGGFAYLHELIGIVPSVASATYYAGIIAEAGKKRRLLHAAAKARDLAQSDMNADAAIEQARADLDSITGPGGAKATFIGDDLDALIDDLSTPPKVIPTPWVTVNDVLGGIGPGQMIVVAARPSVGKSVIALQLASQLTRYGAVAMVSLEMPRSEIFNRLMATQARLDLSKLIKRDLSQQDWNVISKMSNIIREVPLAILDNPSADVTAIRRFARETNRRAPLAGIVVDYLQLMAQPVGDRQNREQFVADTTRRLKILAMELQVPVIVLSQLNRNSESRADKMPTISDLRESGAIEQDADVVLLLHREIMGEKTSDLAVLIAKNRNGRTGLAELQFYGRYSMALDERLSPHSPHSFTVTDLGRIKHE